MRRWMLILWPMVALGCQTGIGFDPDDDDDAGGDDDDFSVDDDDHGGTDNDGDGWTQEEGDCDDNDPDVHPGAQESCNGIDDDCDGDIDEDTPEGGYYATDADGDGFGAAGTMAWRCSGVENEADCNDNDPGEPIVVDRVNGTPMGDGSIDDPLFQIQEGIELAMECVVVLPGTYEEALDFMGKDIWVTGVDGPELTIVDASGYGDPVVTFAAGETAAARLSGLKLINGSGHLAETSYSWQCTSVDYCTDYYTTYCGGGVYVDGASPTLENLIIEGISLPPGGSTSTGTTTYYTYSFGAALCLLGSNTVGTGVAMYGNFADQGGAVYCDEYSDAELRQALVLGNSATDGGAIQVNGGSLTLGNLVLGFNSASGDGGGILAQNATLAMTNVTVGGNAAANGGGVYLSGMTSGAVRNTIIYGSSLGEGVLVDGSASFIGSFNDVYGNASGQYAGTTDPTGSLGNISADPQFVSVTSDGNAYNDDWHLGPGSPCVDAGDSSAPFNDADGSVNDMGAYGGPDGVW